MTDIIRAEGSGNLPEKKPMTENEMIEAKNKFLIQKYYSNTNSQVDLDSLIRYAVFQIKVEQSEEHSKSKLVSVCNTRHEAIEEIRWRASFENKPNTDLAMKNDKRFSSFADETQRKINGKEVLHGDAKYKDTNHYLGLELSYSGLYYIQEVYEVG